METCSCCGSKFGHYSAQPPKHLWRYKHLCDVCYGALDKFLYEVISNVDIRNTTVRLIPNSNIIEVSNGDLMAVQLVAGDIILAMRKRKCGEHDDRPTILEKEIGESVRVYYSPFEPHEIDGAWFAYDPITLVLTSTEVLSRTEVRAKADTD